MLTENHIAALEGALVVAGVEWYRPIGSRAAAELWAAEGFTVMEFEAIVPTRCFDPVVARSIYDAGIVGRAREFIMVRGITDTIGHALMRGDLYLGDLCR